MCVCVRVLCKCVGACVGACVCACVCDGNTLQQIFLHLHVHHNPKTNKTNLSSFLVGG